MKMIVKPARTIKSQEKVRVNMNCKPASSMQYKM